MYNLDYFIRKFENIPEDKWCTGLLTNYTDDKHCFYGHCGVRKQVDYNNIEEAKAAHSIGKNNGIDFIIVNDGLNPRYPQSNPKQRILAALYDIKIAQAKIKYVAVSEKIREEVPKVLEEVN